MICAIHASVWWLRYWLVFQIMKTLSSMSNWFWSMHLCYVCMIMCIKNSHNILMYFWNHIGATKIISNFIMIASLPDVRWIPKAIDLTGVNMEDHQELLSSLFSYKMSQYEDVMSIPFHSATACLKINSRTNIGLFLLNCCFIIMLQFIFIQDKTILYVNESIFHGQYPLL